MYRATFATHVREGAKHLEPAACAFREIPPLVQPLPFATCRQRPTNSRAHFSVFTALFEETVSPLCSPLLWPAANP